MYEHREMHANSLETYREELPELSRRAKEVFRIFYFGRNKSFTDRQILRVMEDQEGHRLDMNYVRPRITELKRLGLLAEDGHVTDAKTGKKVRTMRLADRYNPARGGDLPRPEIGSSGRLVLPDPRQRLLPMGAA